MGQLIEVGVTPIGRVALFTLDRSLTGQDGVGFTSATGDKSPPAELARRLLESDDSIESVYVLSNTVSVLRTDGWDDTALGVSTNIISKLFVFYDSETADDQISRLRDQHYNATITAIRAHNEDLWVMKVTPDEPLKQYEPGQYTTLGLGFWESRADHVTEDFEAKPEQYEKMAFRSYSVASSIVTDEGELVDAHPDDVEFYVVQVRPEEREIPVLTPRIFSRTVGDRIYLGRKFTGKYTLGDIAPADSVVFLSTGTGEAPQNTMTAELLRKRHTGRIISVVCVRYKRDLAYTMQQNKVEDLHPNYRFIGLTTREPENERNKVYIQDLITSGRLQEALGAPLDPDHTQVFLCGNPAMIGLPKMADDGSLDFPESLGACQLFHEMGFTIDRRKERGNVHYEEYWRDR